MLALTERHKGVIAIVIGAILWSTAGLFIKLLPQNAMTILFYRSMWAGLVFFILYRKEVFRFNRQMWINSIFYTLLLMAFVTATKLTTAANAIFLQFTAPVYVLLLEPRLFKIALDKLNVWTILICIVGLLLFFVDDMGGGNQSGNLIALFSGVMLAGLLLGQRLNPVGYHVAAIFWGNVWVALLTLPAFMASSTPSMSEFGMLSFLGIVQIGLGYAFFTYGLKRTTAIESALLGMVEPVFNPIWVFLGYGERPSQLAILGGILIICTLIGRALIIEWRKKRGIFPPTFKPIT